MKGAIKKLGSRLRSPRDGPASPHSSKDICDIPASSMPVSITPSLTNNNSNNRNNNTVSASLQSAKDKLLQGASPYPLEDLPHDRADPLWNEIRTEYNLTLPELGALKNAASSPGGFHVEETSVYPEEIEVSLPQKVEIVQQGQEPQPQEQPIELAKPEQDVVLDKTVIPTNDEANVEKGGELEITTQETFSDSVEEAIPYVDEATYLVQDQQQEEEPVVGTNNEEDLEEPVAPAEDAELDEIDNMLADMDAGFDDLTNIVDGSSAGRDDGAFVMKPSPEMEFRDIEKWDNRLKREEVFSLRYHLSKAEKKEVLDLENQLQMKSAQRFLSTFIDSSACFNEAVWKQLAHPEGKAPASILLKRGSILFKSSMDKEEMDREGELIVLTHGFVLASVEQQKQRQANVSRKFERAIHLNDIIFVSPDSDEECAWEMYIRSNGQGQEKLSFVSGSPNQQAAWLRAMETVVVNHFMHDGDFTKDLGWQYGLVHKAGFTRAVLGIEDDLLVPEGGSLNDLDSYNGYAPLHVRFRKRMVSIPHHGL